MLCYKNICIFAPMDITSLHITSLSRTNGPTTSPEVRILSLYYPKFVSYLYSFFIFSTLKSPLFSIGLIPPETHTYLLLSCCRSIYCTAINSFNIILIFGENHFQKQIKKSFYNSKIQHLK